MWDTEFQPAAASLIAQHQPSLFLVVIPLVTYFIICFKLEANYGPAGHVDDVVCGGGLLELGDCAEDFSVTISWFCHTSDDRLKEIERGTFWSSASEYGPGDIGVLNWDRRGEWSRHHLQAELCSIVHRP